MGKFFIEAGLEDFLENAASFIFETSGCMQQCISIKYTSRETEHDPRRN